MPFFNVDAEPYNALIDWLGSPRKRFNVGLASVFKLVADEEDDDRDADNNARFIVEGENKMMVNGLVVPREEETYKEWKRKKKRE